MQLVHTPWVRTLLFSALSFAAAVLYCQTHFYRDPGSRFFDKTRAYEQGYGHVREQEVESYIKAASNGASHPQAGPDPQICATFMSVKREGEQYLPFALASSLAGLSKQERSDLYMNVFIAQTDYASHPSTSLRWLHDVADQVSNYNTTSEQLDKLRELEESRNFAEKGVLDYTYALQQCYDTGAPWIVLFEDDVMLAETWFIQTLRGVIALRNRAARSTKDWSYMRLFNQERSTGWASRRIGGNNELLISILVAVPTAVIMQLIRRSSRAGRRNVDHASVIIICLFTIPAFIVLFFQAGKASLLPPGPGIRAETFGCCSQGLVFQRQSIPTINEYLLDRKEGQIDLMLNDMTWGMNLLRYSLYPVQLQHIGKRSARQTAEQEAQAIWSMAFEQQDPLHVRRTHQRMVGLMYNVR